MMLAKLSVKKNWKWAAAVIFSVLLLLVVRLAFEALEVLRMEAIATRGHIKCLQEVPKLGSAKLWSVHVYRGWNNELPPRINIVARHPKGTSNTDANELGRRCQEYVESEAVDWGHPTAVGRNRYLFRGEWASNHTKVVTFEEGEPVH